MAWIVRVDSDLGTMYGKEFHGTPYGEMMPISPEDELRSLVRLLWRDLAVSARATRGPAPRVSVDHVVTTAVGIADRDGLAAVTMRALAAQVGVGAMSLYTYVPTRDVLVALMVDAVAEPVEVGDSVTPIEAIAVIARTTRSEFRAHPWLLDTPDWRQVLGPRRLARYESQLAAIAGLPLDDLERDALVATVAAFASGSARDDIGASSVVRQSAMTDGQWWEIVGPELGSVVPTGMFPLADRVGTAVGEKYGASGNPDAAFEFGLARILEGVGAMVAVRQHA